MASRGELVAAVFQPGALWKAERAVLAAAAAGNWAELTPRPDRPELELTMRKPRVRAEFLRHLLLRLPSPSPGGESVRQGFAPWAIASPGVRICGAEIVGELDLTDAVSTGLTNLAALALEHCDLPEPLILNYAQAQRLSVKGSRLCAMSAAESMFDGQLNLSFVRPFPKDGAPEQCSVRLSGARVDGDLLCLRSRLVAPPAPAGERRNFALALDDVEINGRITAVDLDAVGGVDLSGAQVCGEVSLAGARLLADSQFALDARLARIQGSLTFSNKSEATTRRFEAQGQTVLSDAFVRGDLDAGGARFIYRRRGGPPGAPAERFAIRATQLKVDGSVLMSEGFLAYGCVRMGSASLGGSFIADSGWFVDASNGQTGAINARNLRIGGELATGRRPHRTVFRAIGEVVLCGADIRGNWIAKRGRFAAGTASESWAIDADGVTVGGEVCFEQAKMSGTLVFRLADIGGNLDLTRAVLRFSKWNEHAIIASDATIRGNLFLNQACSVKGHVSLRSTSIQNDLRVALSKDSETVWNLDGGSAGVLDDGDGAGWGGPGRARLSINDFRYRSLARAREESDPDPLPWLARNRRAKARRQWLEDRVEPSGAFSPLPYVHLAKVFRNMGYEEDARSILRYKARREGQRSNPASAFISLVYGWCFGYGYSTGRALATFLACWVVGGLATNYCNQIGMLGIDAAPVSSVLGRLDQPAIPRGSNEALQKLPCGDAINPFLYALDIFVPVIDLRQAARCEPMAVNPPKVMPRLLGLSIPVDKPDTWRTARSFYAIMGWIVTALMVLTFSGVLQVKTDER